VPLPQRTYAKQGCAIKFIFTPIILKFLSLDVSWRRKTAYLTVQINGSGQAG
jgi:hypothetical protein